LLRIDEIHATPDGFNPSRTVFGEETQRWTRNHSAMRSTSCARTGVANVCEKSQRDYSGGRMFRISDHQRGCGRDCFRTWISLWTPVRFLRTAESDGLPAEWGQSWNLDETWPMQQDPLCDWALGEFAKRIPDRLVTIFSCRKLEADSAELSYCGWLNCDSSARLKYSVHPVESSIWSIRFICEMWPSCGNWHTKRKPPSGAYALRMGGPDINYHGAFPRWQGFPTPVHCCRRVTSSCRPEKKRW